MRLEAQDHYRGRVLQCHACAERERAAKKFTTQPHDPSGLLFTVEEMNGG